MARIKLRSTGLGMVAGGMMLGVMLASPAMAQIVIGGNDPDVVVNWSVLDRLGQPPTLADMLKTEHNRTLPPSAAQPHGSQAPGAVQFKPYKAQPGKSTNPPGIREARNTAKKPSGKVVAAKPAKKAAIAAVKPVKPAPTIAKAAPEKISPAKPSAVAELVQPSHKSPPPPAPVVDIPLQPKIAGPQISLPETPTPKLPEAQPQKIAAAQPQKIAEAQPQKAVEVPKVEPVKSPAPEKPAEPAKLAAAGAALLNEAKSDSSRPVADAQSFLSTAKSDTTTAPAKVDSLLTEAKNSVPPAAVPAPPPPQLATLPAAPAPAAQPAISKGDTLTLLFANDSSQLPPGSLSALDRLVNRMTRDESQSLQLLAYADGDEANASKARRLSLSRALEVRKYLMDQGIRSTRIEVRALGNKVERGPADRVDAVLVSR